MALDNALFPDDAHLRLCGDVRGKRVVTLGADPEVALLFARHGARVLAVDPDAAVIAESRAAAEAAGLSVELHHSDLADLGFATSASIDVVFSAGGLARTDDLARLLRQVHRVLKPGAPAVFVVAHPVATMLDGGGAAIVRPYGADGRTVATYFTTLTRADLQVDVMTEDHAEPAPHTLVIRARKLGV